MPEIQLIDDGDTVESFDVPSGDELTREEVIHLCEKFSDVLAYSGFKCGRGSTGGVDLEWYCEMDKADGEIGPYNINITFMP